MASAFGVDFESGPYLMNSSVRVCGLWLSWRQSSFLAVEMVLEEEGEKGKEREREEAFQGLFLLDSLVISGPAPRSNLRKEDRTDT